MWKRQDRGLVELNTSSNHQFGHLHLFSEDPVAAGEWYSKHFGIPRRGTAPVSREPRFYRDFSDRTQCIVDDG
jgi:hypothetical protein